MLEPPADLSLDALRRCVETAYALDAAEVTFLPLGHDALAWVYRVLAADGRAYFLKARRTLTNEAGLLVPRYLHERGVRQVVAPLPTTAGRLWSMADAYAVILYPFVAGPTGMQHDMSDAQWIEYGSLLGQIHATALTPELIRVMRRDTFAPDGAAMVRRLDAYLGAPDAEVPEVVALAAFWQAHRQDILTVLAQAEALGARLAVTDPDVVLCHADVHTNNVLLDPHGRVWIVDWDETTVAPRERDLMFVVGGGIVAGRFGPHQEALFFEGYGHGRPATMVDPLALAYYRHAWAVSDIGAYGEQLCFRPDLGPDTRRDDAVRFRTLFAPGNIVDLSLRSAVPPG